jgi:hypothetical protein
MSQANNQTNFPLGYKLQRLQHELYQKVHHFRKEYKYTLGQAILTKCWQVMDGVYQANNLEPNKRKQPIIDACIAFDQLKNRLKMAHDLKLISHQQLGHLSKQLVEIGKMLTGWKKWAQKQS